MKKVFFFAAAVVAMVACNKTESSISISNPEEIGFTTMAQNATRGFILSNGFYECTNPDSFTDTTDIGLKYNSTLMRRDSTWRVMNVSAYNVTDGADYFINQKFESDSSKVTDASIAKAIWRAKPTMYWPIGKDLKFLTYSSKNIAGRSDVNANWDGALKVSFDVTPLQCYQNDIVYGEASGSNRGNTLGTDVSSHDKGLNVTFYHSQAWLTFNITVKGADSTVAKSLAANPDSARIKVDKIVLENVFNSGVLTFSYTGTKTPDAKWDFFTQNPSDVEVDDPYKVLSKGTNGLLYAKKYSKKSASTTAVGDSLDYNGLQLNMLMPPQDHNDFVLYYTMNGKQNSIKLPFTGAFDDKTAYTAGKFPVTGTGGSKTTGAAGVWKMGFHYVYNITIEINELTFAPSVDMWTAVTGFGTNPQAL